MLVWKYLENKDGYETQVKIIHVFLDGMKKITLTIINGKM